MIEQLFDWTEWDDIGTTIEQYYNCTLKVPIGNFEIGTFIPLIVIDQGKSTLTIYLNSDTISSSEHKLILTVV